MFIVFTLKEQQSKIVKISKNSSIIIMESQNNE